MGKRVQKESQLRRQLPWRVPVRPHSVVANIGTDEETARVAVAMVRRLSPHPLHVVVKTDNTTYRVRRQRRTAIGVAVRFDDETIVQAVAVA